MCGFVMTFSRPSSPPTTGDICQALSHRGPDSCGHVLLGDGNWRADLHFRRLAIVDLQHRSDQPFGGPDSGTLAYNGEIYNAAYVRSTLRSRGVAFSTEGDTEVMHAVLRQPDWLNLLSSLDGMYAFAFIDRHGHLRYGRDRLGIKPLYEARSASGQLLGLASELEPLRQAGLLGAVDEAAVAASAMFLWVPPPATGWRGAFLTEPGTVTSHTLSALASKSAVVPLQELASFTGSIREAVRSSVRRQVEADVPVALLLSGGLDSTWLAYELADMGLDVPLLSARSVRASRTSSEPFQEDAPFAARVAEDLGRDLTWFDLDDWILAGIPAMVTTLEQPFADPAAISLAGLSHAARQEATVLLSGVGVEELFLGYERYQAIKALDLVAPARKGLGTLLGHAPMPLRLRERAGKFERLLRADPSDWPWVSQSYYSADTYQRLVPGVPLADVVTQHRDLAQQAMARGATPLEAAAVVDRSLFLPGLNLMYADRASMAASVELRVPFLGDQVHAAALARDAADHVRIGNGKRLFRQAAAGAGVPDFVLKRSKTGFGAPVRSLLREHGDTVWSSVSRGALFDDLLDRSVCTEMVRAHIRGDADYGLQVFSFCALAAWWEKNVAGDGSVSDYLSDCGL